MHARQAGGPRRSRSSRGPASRAARARTPWPRGARARCGRRAAGKPAWRSWRFVRAPVVEECERLEAALPMEVAAVGGYDGSRDAQPVALPEALCLQHPVGEHREARLDVGGVRIVPVEPQLAGSHGAELLGEEPLLARERLPGDLAWRVARAVRAEHVELLLARHGNAFLADAARVFGRRAREEIGPRIHDHGQAEID